MTHLELHPDRALPLDSEQRRIAKEIYGETKGLPLICMHGHVDAQVFADDVPFADPAQLLIVPDHYVFRMLASQGIDIADLGVPRVDGGPVESDSRKIWRTFCENWKLYRGTPSRYWLEHELVEVFGVDLVPSAETADAIYDQIAARVAEPEFRPRALLDRFNIEVISTTDPATSQTASSTRSSPPTAWASGCCPPSGPTPWSTSIGRPGGPRSPSWRPCRESTRRRTTASWTHCVSAAAAFVEAGALATDHGHLLADTTPMDAEAARGLYARVLDGEDATEAEVVAFAANMLFQMAEMACEDGLVMQIHPGVLRDHNAAIAKTHGQDKGYDIPIQSEYTNALRPMLDRFGTDPAVPGHPLHRRRDRVQPGTGPDRRRLSLGPAGRPVVVPGFPRGHAPLPRGRHRDRRLLQHVRLRGRHPGLRVDPRPPRPLPSRRRRLPGPAGPGASPRPDEAVETAVDLAYNLPKQSYARR